MSSRNMNNLPAKGSRMPLTDGRGMTMSEIRYRRAMVALEKEFCKEKVNMSVMKIRNFSFFGSSSSSTSGKVAGAAGKLFSKISYFDYAMIGMSLFSSVRKIYRKIKKKK